MLFLLNLKHVSFRFVGLITALIIISATVLYIGFFEQQPEEYLEQAKFQREHALNIHEAKITNSIRQVEEYVEAIALSTNLKPLALSHQTETGLAAFYLDKTSKIMGWPEGWINHQRQQLTRLRSSDVDSSNPLFKLFKVPLVQQAYWTEIFWDEYNEQYVMSYLIPYQKGGPSHQQEAPAFVGALLSVDGLLGFNPNNIATTKRFIHDDNGSLLFHPDISLALLRQTKQFTDNSQEQSSIRKPIANFIEDNVKVNFISSFEDWNGTTLVSSRKIEALGWYLVAYQNKAELMAPIEKRNMEYWLMVIGITAIVAIVAKYAMSSWILAPMKKVTNAIEAEALTPIREVRNQGGEWADFAAVLYEKLKILKQTSEQQALKLEALEQSLIEQKGLAHAINNSDQAIMILNDCFEIAYADAKTMVLLGRDRESLIGYDFYQLVHPLMGHMPDQIRNEIRRKSRWRGELILKRVNSTQEVWVNCNISPMYDDEGRLIRFVVSQVDISHIKESQSKIDQLVYTDDLTCLSNRTFFVAQLDKLVEMSKRGRYHFALIYIGVDDFKKVNESYGHDVGDRLLKELSQRLKLEIRNEDTLARMSGDEFAILFSGMASEQAVVAKVNQILNSIQQPFQIKRKLINSTISIGITLSKADEKVTELMLQHASLAMNEAKALGKNTYHFYSKALNEATKHRLKIENALLGAIEENELSLYYQPKVNSENNELIGFEALIRWQNIELGFVSPAEFIPIAEQSSLILKIGTWVIHEAAKFVSEHKLDVPVSINISARQFESGNVAGQLKQVIDDYNLSASLLEVEITESSLIVDVEGAIAQLYSIKALGVSISIDDFGTGYSSLSYIKRFPVETLKIDRSFIKDIPDDQNDMEITAAIIAMAQKLGLNVIAEGVETQAQVDYLAENGCNLIQGYFYSKPLVADEAKCWSPAAQEV